MNRLFFKGEEEPVLAVLDEDNNVIPTCDLLKWALFFENFERRIVAKTRVSGLEVSTVFLGFNYGVSHPLWFETMVFADPDRAIPPEVEVLLSKWREHQLERYSDWAQAEEGHARMVQIIQEGLI
jgi:hypothetical protein